MGASFIRRFFALNQCGRKRFTALPDRKALCANTSPAISHAVGTIPAQGRQNVTGDPPLELCRLRLPAAQDETIETRLRDDIVGTATGTGKLETPSLD